ncbi:hypothetical protein ZHAS_00017477 [Anopheles sinensis]|uniref:Uncharacterized protein n=1 Tax=Anopheles sinensis TaxID=74873 RepID=A0A084WGN5_ANOSI|nr:hypothetical protein ZHAS_00017477 [Anopheles sinensis]
MSREKNGMRTGFPGGRDADAEQLKNYLRNGSGVITVLKNSLSLALSLAAPYVRTPSGLKGRHGQKSMGNTTHIPAETPSAEGNMLC